jgi:hypothetical protein
VSILYFGQFNPFCYSLPPSFSSPINQQLSIHIVISYTCTDVMYFDITDALSFSFPFFLSLSSIEQFHCHKYVLHLSLCMIMLAFMYVFIFWIYLPPTVRESMQPLSFWTWLTLELYFDNRQLLPFSLIENVIPLQSRFYYCYEEASCVQWLLFWMVICFQFAFKIFLFVFIWLYSNVSLCLLLFVFLFEIC